MTETWEQTNEKITFKNWNIISRPRPENNHGGVAVLTKQSEHFLIERKKDLENPSIEAICTEIKLPKGESFLLIVSYIPPNKTEAMKGLVDLIDNCKENYNRVLVTGDLNAKSKVWSNRTENHAGELLEDFMWKSSYICLNDGLPTRRNSDSVIDLVLVTPTLVKQVTSCQTLVHENIRSDHIGVLIDIYQDAEQAKGETAERLRFDKTDWDRWDTITGEKFEDWIGVHKDEENIDSMYSSFLETFSECVDECTPKVQVPSDSQQKRPPWYNEDVRIAKNEWNAAKKHFKRRKTPYLLQSLKEKESAYEDACDRAKTEWVNETCETIDKCRNPKEKWSAFHRLTSYQEKENKVLPLLDTDNKPVFENEAKCDLLKKAFFGGEHIAQEKFDEDFKQTVERRYDMIQNEVEHEEPHGFLDREISESEVEAALQKLEDGKAPGPDDIYSNMLMKCNPSLLRAITVIFQKSFASGQLPQVWKKANIKFIQKPGKSTYHLAGSYRPISLTSTLGKCLERIVNTRIYSYAEHHQLLDKEQDGFRERRGTTQALLRLVEDVSRGLNKNDATAAVYVDMEKAFDTVWRKGLMVKLRDMGIQGKMWFWLNNFLSDRSGVCCLSNFKSNQFTTEIGLPQGSVLSPLLFNLFIRDIFNSVKSDKVKFADDGTIWKSDSDCKTLETCLQEDLDTISSWTKKWRMKLNVEKTEFCIFQKNTEEDTTITLTLEGRPLKRVKKAKILGVIIDDKLSFSDHVQHIESKAAKALGLLHYAGSTEKISPENMVKLYKSIVVPYLEYAAPVWQSSSCTQSLEKIQRKGLRLCLGGTSSASCEGLEIQANVMPLDLRREEISIRECSKILAKDESSLIKEKLLECRDSPQTVSSKPTPLSTMVAQTADMEALTDVDIKCIEPEMTYLECLQPSRRRPTYWNNLGSSKSRTEEQQNQARSKIQELMMEDEVGTVVAFTDGSCRGNPGPCGAGSCIYKPGEDRIDLKQPVSKLASILVGELVAIKMTLRHILGDVRTKPLNHIRIMSDSQTAIGILTLGWSCNAHLCLINEIKALWKELENLGTRITLDWAPGHANIEGNEVADRLAKAGAEEAERMETDSTEPISQAEIRKATKDAMMIKWQRRWELTDKARQLFEVKPSINTTKSIDFAGQDNQRTLLQLQSGHCTLRDHLYRLGLKNDPLCDCGQPETVDHYLLRCVRYEGPRETMLANIYLQTGIRHTQVTSQLLLTTGPEDPFKDNRTTLVHELDQYIAKSNRFNQ